MSGLMDKAKDAVGGQGSQPGNGVEGAADKGANQGISPSPPTLPPRKINQVASDAGVPQGADSTIDKAADSKINDEIPGGN
ncbi:Uu.00g139430.m01.CDS01 [Anthostomella pinea]|uniref:Uu.00g139430.m01.CDS01 n=1 Tax=Anthostomella pinea TaxID=933095 RepID=A0AAI8VPY1_9PEZI|nr:Uu.00g139430.m01.CDS01 [Anthostomella pinea]